MIRTATWNMQAVMPVRSDGKWGYLHDVVRPDVAVLTEAKPEEAGYRLFYREGGLGNRRRWGTIVATAPTVDATEATTVRRGLRAHSLIGTWPGSVVVADLVTPAGTGLTLVGVYAVTTDDQQQSVGHGYYTSRSIVNELAPLFEDPTRPNILLAGDLNLLPPDARYVMASLPLVDLVERTGGSRPPNEDCACEDPKPTAHIWTHRNKGRHPKEQQVDYLYATESLAERLTRLEGGPADFPDIWEWSDHAPLVAEFDV